MKKKSAITVVSVFVLIITVVFYFRNDKVIKQNKINKEKVVDLNENISFIDVPYNLDTISFKASITLNKLKKINKIQFTSGGTSTSISIYNASFLMDLTNKKESKSLVEGHFKNAEKAILDISSLKSGKYYVHYISCDMGGIFPLTIKDENKH